MLFIFDWDGTLVDSKAMITRSMQLAATNMGWEPLEDALIHNIIGLGLPEAILRLYPQVSDQERARLRDFYAGNFVRLYEEKSSDFFPVVPETLEALRNQGHLLTIATGKSRKGLDRILADLGMSTYFDATRCADETASKPHPLMLEQLLAHFDVEAREAVMIGDTEYDMEMARSISMPRIAVSYGAHHIDRLHPYEPELCLDQFDQLLGWHRIN
ncbi:hydrolase [Cellvibrio zantedeschiae]|uniref:Hydrolase n=1 Tax=Cellvibrio zantedeschiae TaxID=1237077 RepID=A0ABQ3AYJ7_9GAMM|nr:HAD-IA family hydrolase [Cellvibrio zantedeschiae]GGY70525.1 hydrolase [Cellvibrio zantedeschiae]